MGLCTGWQEFSVIITVGTCHRCLLGVECLGGTCLPCLPYTSCHCHVHLMPYAYATTLLVLRVQCLLPAAHSCLLPASLQSPFCSWNFSACLDLPGAYLFFLTCLESLLYLSLELWIFPALPASWVLGGSWLGAGTPCLLLLPATL